MHTTLRQMLFLALIASLLGAAIFGFSVVTMAFGSEGHASCLASVLQGGAQCSNVMDPFAFMSFHRAALSSLVGVVTVSLLLLLSGILVAALLALLHRAALPDPPSFFPVSSFQFLPVRIRSSSPNSWLALLEHSPARVSDA